LSPLFGRQTKTFIDPSRGDAEASRLRAAVESRDWREVDQAMGGANEPLRREFLVDAVSQQSGDPAWADPWINEQPNSATARLMWGACAAQSGPASTAAVSAALASSVDASATSHSDSPVEGSSTDSVPFVPSRHSLYTSTDIFFVCCPCAAQRHFLGSNYTENLL